MEHTMGDKVSILVVDDKPDNLRLLNELLGNKGYEIRLASNDEVALESANLALPDIVLLDINMPGMDGYEVCRRLKEIPGFGDTPVIFVSALSDIGVKVNAFKNGGVDYITKPIEAEELHARIETHLSLARLRKESREQYEELRHLEGLRDRLVKMLAHDIRGIYLWFPARYPC